MKTKITTTQRTENDNIVTKKGKSRKKKTNIIKLRLFGILFAIGMTIINVLLLIPVIRNVEYHINMKDNMYYESNYETSTYYHSYKIKSGDTISSIAADIWNTNPDLYEYKYRDLDSLINSIFEMNQLKNPDNIHYGYYLVVPEVK